MGCGTTTVKIASIVFNIFLAIIAIGGIVWISLNLDYFRVELSIGYYVTLSLCIVFACLGIYATIRESICLTATCAAFLLALTLISIAISIVAINSGKHNPVNVVHRAWDTNTMDELQRRYDCCGKDSANDYILMNKRIPISCYLNQDISDIHNLFTEGCSGVMVKYYERETFYFAIYSWFCVLFEFVGFLLAVFLLINFRNTQRRMQF